MGGPKALMDVGGRPWWHVQAERLGAVGLPATWVVSEEVAKSIEAARPEPTLRLVRSDPDAPMFESLMAGLRAIAAVGPRGAFVLPVDVPAPLIEVWRALRGSITPAIPEFEGKRGHPVYLPWAWIEARLLGAVSPPPEERRLDVMIQAEARSVPVADRTITVNLNTRADVENLVRQANQDLPQSHRGAEID